MGKAKVPLIVLADHADNAVSIHQHHIIRQHKIVLRIDDLQQILQVQIVPQKCRQFILHCTSPFSLYSSLIINATKLNSKSFLYLANFHNFCKFFVKIKIFATFLHLFLDFLHFIQF